MKTSLSHLMCVCAPMFMGLRVEKRKSHKISISMIAAKFWVSSLVINPSSGKMCCPFRMTKCTRFIIFVSVCELGTSSWNESSHLNKLLILITPHSTVAYQLIYQEVTRTEKNSVNKIDRTDYGLSVALENESNEEKRSITKSKTVTNDNQFRDRRNEFIYGKWIGMETKQTKKLSLFITFCEWDLRQI